MSIPSNELVSTRQLATKFRVHQSRVRKLLADTPPAVEAPYGNGLMRYWLRAEAEAVMQAWYDAAHPAPNPPPPTPTPDPLDNGTLNEILNKLGETSRNFNTVFSQLDALEAVAEQVGKLAEQNRLIFKALQEFRPEVGARLDRIDAKLQEFEVLDQSATSELDAEPEPLPEPAPTDGRQRVAIAALHSHQKSIIEREFGHVFDLRIYGSNELKTKRFRSVLSSVDHLVVMAPFVGHSVMHAAKASGVRTVVLHGGMSGLRDHLLEAYATPKPADEAQTA